MHRNRKKVGQSLIPKTKKTMRTYLINTTDGMMKIETDNIKQARTSAQRVVDRDNRVSGGKEKIFCITFIPKKSLNKN